MAGHERDWRGVARYGLPGMLLGLALAWGGVGGRGLWAQGPTGERPRVQPAATGGEAGGTLAFTTPFPTTAGAGPAQLLYLVDTRARAFAVYRIDPSRPSGAVKLEASRQYQWDLKLSEYNNQAPEPAAIEAAVKAAGPVAR